MSSERFSKGPAHLRVRDLLAQKIAAGEWDAGKELPSASVLARQLGVSCRTIRSALELLERECAVVRKLGGGTFVAAGDVDQRTIRIGDPGSDSSEASEIHLGTLVEGWADEAECARLDLRASDRVYRIRRTRYAMGMLFMAERTTLMAALFPGLADRAFPAHGILDLARLYGFRLGIAREQASIGIASAAAVEMLGFEEGSLVLVLDRVVTTRDGRPVEWRIGECSLTEQHLSGIAGRGGSPG